MILNTYIRTSGLYDGVADFDAATLDPSTGNMKAGEPPYTRWSSDPARRGAPRRRSSAARILSAHPASSSSPRLR
jgi:hypothetical protein